ncbi:MAG: DHHA1 domain-containing protein, partial [Eubacteriales bacterium]|nr:DHHA1 domain-containing protein [Eubacteriales bacterium]
IYLHRVRVTSGSFINGMKVMGSVDRRRRLSIARNHTATHLLHEALRRVLGEHVVQKGSYVSANRLRFDFQHEEPLNAEEKDRIEEIVNTAILDNYPVVTEVKGLEEARSSGAMALFGDTYDELVRVISIGDFSCELCGGTHLSSSGEIGLFFISSEGGIASGVRRIEAITGEAAHDAAFLSRSVVRRLLQRLHVDQANDIFSRLEEKDQELDELNKVLSKQREEEQQEVVLGLLDQQEKIGDFVCIFAQVEDFEAEAMRIAGDKLRDHLGENAVILLASRMSADKIIWLAMVGKAAIASGAKAGDLIRIAAAISGGKGGGRPDMAQGGGNDPDKIGEAFAVARDKLKEIAGL